MERLSRYILVLIAIISSSVILPQLYWMAFEKSVSVPFVRYSCTDDDFIIKQSENDEAQWTDTRGNKYKRQEFEKKLPLIFTKQLLISGIMPDSIKGVAIDMHQLAKTNSTFRFKPEFLKGPKQKLFPLFESESGRAKLEIPEDFFRINWRIEFIEAETNTVDEAKSQLFSGVLFKKGFVFPAKSISGLPTTHKSCDEGYLIIDSSDQLFHLKMMEGNPYVRKVELPEGLKFNYIGCVDFNDKKYYAYLFSDQNEIYILTQDYYELVKLPIEGFDPDNCELQIFGDMFHYNVIIESENHIKDDVLNYSDYKEIDTYENSWLKRSERPAGKIAAAIFPVQIKMSDNNSKFTNFYPEFSSGFIWIIVNLIFAGLHLLLLARREVKLKKHLIDLGVIALSGIFGFIAVHFFQNKFFD